MLSTFDVFYISSVKSMFYSIIMIDEHASGFADDRWLLKYAWKISLTITMFYSHFQS